MALTALQVRKAREPGKYSDGRGLMLVVKPSGAGSWVLRAMVGGKRYEVGLGSREDVSLAEARERANETRKKLRAGATPASLRAEAKRAQGMTFAEAARRVHAERAGGWKNKKHAAQWIATLEAYAFPAFGNVIVADIGSAHILEAIQPLWLAKPETARRTKQRIGTVLDWAHAREHRTEAAPMRAVNAALKKQKTGTKRHFPSMPYRDVPGLMRKLEASRGTGALALRFAILTAARSGEVRGATWAEIDEDARTWTIPAGRMKAGQEHTAPLSEAAMALLAEAKALTGGAPDALLFPGQRGRPLSDATLAKAMTTAGAGEYTVHGMRSTFRDWAAEQTDYPHEVAEAALAHTVRDAVVRAYRRTDFFEKRRGLMAEWGRHCEGARADD